MTATYPFGLRTVLASKSRAQPAAFTMSEPRRGAAYVRAIGTDTPVFWDVSFVFSQSEAIRFQLWFKNTISRGVDAFVLPLKTEFGYLDHECRFLPDGVLNCQQNGALWTYKATIFARAQVVPEEYELASDIMVSMPNWEEYGSWLDIAIVDNWGAQA